MGFWSSITKPFKKVIHAIGRIGGNDPYGNWSGWGAVPSPESQRIEADKARSDAEREAQRRAHEEEVQSLAMGAADILRNRRRKGAYATILTGGVPLSYASPSKSSGKTLLGQ